MTKTKIRMMRPLVSPTQPRPLVAPRHATRRCSSLRARSVAAVCLSLLVAAGAWAAEKAPPGPVLLVHGIAHDLQKADPIWGSLDAGDPDRPRWGGMIGFLDAQGLTFGGEIVCRGPAIRLPEDLDCKGVRGDPRQATLFSLALSPAANTDGLAYKALELAEALRRLRAYTGAPKVRVLTHSAGGLVARVYLQGVLPGVPYAGDVDRLVTIGCPHLGAGMASSLGDLLGTRATSLKPDAPLIQDLNRRFDLPAEVRFGAIVVRGKGADERGEGPAYDHLLDRALLARLPGEYQSGGDQLIHVRSQNLRLADCAARYERATGRPVQYAMARVPDPSPGDWFFPAPRVHATSPSNPVVQRLALAMLEEHSPLWNPLDEKTLQPWVERQARMHAEGLIEARALEAHPASQIKSVTLSEFRRLDKQGPVHRYAIAGKAFSSNLLLRLRNRWTEVQATMQLTFDPFGRVVQMQSQIQRQQDE